MNYFSQPAKPTGLDVSCMFNSKKYKPGESWHPYLEPQGVMYCIRCTCFEDTNVSCSQIQCPALQCPNPISDPHQCCPRCPELLIPSGAQTPTNSSCQYNGTTYQHGNIFTNSELFPSRQSNQCAQCSCSEGQIYCGLVTCPELLCASPETIPDSCCQVCRDGSYEKLIEEPQLYRGARHPQYQCTGGAGGKGSSESVDSPTGASLEFLPKSIKNKGGSGGTTVRIILKEQNKKACVYNGKTYSHGEVWHPTIRHFVLLPCILCTCNDGSQDCRKITCPKEYPCEKPENVAGKCCKVCPEDKVPPPEGIDAIKCRVSVYMFVPSATSKNPKENLRKIAIERESSEDVEIYIWKLVKGIFHLIQIRKVKKQEFKQEVQNFRLISRTNEVYWNMFLVQGPEVKISESSDKETKNL
ncbi:chordin-like protein 2 isoform X2 [Rhineura floridana]|uniref:chordin-like protein 2 isoform X2 n=1 Tax=Rhineura floridana TaxID=261503 RepID=UPI002AC808A8|nr:chordin-like protein 2 isoform X2 [Rhineura floridana]